MLIIFALSVVATLVFFLMMPRVEGSIFHANLHFVCHFSIMIMGAIAYRGRQRMIWDRKWLDLAGMMASFVAYFLLMKIGKGQTGWRYDTQILALLPLHTFVWYAYKVSSRYFIANLFHRKYTGRILHVVASLTLEIYIVQFAIITNRFNALFPFNTVIVFLLICVAAYLLRVATSFFLQFLSSGNFEWRKMGTV